MGGVTGLNTSHKKSLYFFTNLSLYIKYYSHNNDFFFNCPGKGQTPKKYPECVVAIHALHIREHVKKNYLP